MTRSLILGTAGHIDHGKTELVRVLTGVDTDRLKEEKERGITIDLGFAELVGEGDVRLGVVDVPGHEGFVRNMLAGATGMDVVLLVVAADEGVMPQTREHLSIVSLLGVERLVVALTKSDLVDEEWLELVREEVRGLLADTPYAGAPLVPTSARSGTGIDDLSRTLADVAATVEEDDPSDLARLPVDRVFTVRGTGTVVTGTLWSGGLRVGERVRLLPGGPWARVRGLQVHGRDVDTARAGERTAVALTGADVDKGAVSRGQALVAGDAWEESSLLTARVRVLADSEWALERGQRVRVHLGTAERMARLVLLGTEALLPGEEGWVQLRLEAPVVARARERFVLRSYSPVATIAGGTIAEPLAPKRNHLDPAEAAGLDAVLHGADAEAVRARAEAAGWSGEPRTRLPVTTGVPPHRTDAVCDALAEASSPSDAERAPDGAPLRVGGVVLAASLVAEATARMEEGVDRFHDEEPLREGIDVEALRQILPSTAPDALADALLARLVAERRLVVRSGIAARPDFSVRPTPAQEARLAALSEAYRSAGLAPPTVAELPPQLRDSPELWALLRVLEARGGLTRLDPELFIWRETLEGAAAEVRRLLAGRSDLGPADFKDALPVTRKHLLPILGYFDQVGLTLRRGNLREVPPV